MNMHENTLPDYPGQQVPETSSSQEGQTQQACVNTTHDDGHMHHVFLDAAGNGTTSMVNGHTHEVRGGNVGVAQDGHSHRVIKPKVFARGQRNVYTNQFDFEAAGFDPSDFPQ